MNKVSKIAAILFLIFGVLLAIFALYKNQSQPEIKNERVTSFAAQQPTVSIVVAARDLPAGHLLTDEDVLLEKVSKRMPENFSEPSLVVGRTTAQEISKNQALNHGQLIDGVAGLLATGERAVSIKVDEASAVGHKIKAGDWVDVFLVIRRDGQEVNSTQSRMLLPRKKVLAYGGNTSTPMQEEETNKQGKNNAVPRTAVLAVQVEEVNRLLLAEQQGQVLLALRSPLDQNEPSADMLERIPGLSVGTPLNQNVSTETSALNASLLALKMSDLGADVAISTAESVKQVSKKVKRQNVNAPTGTTVEMIRGNRKETVRY